MPSLMPIRVKFSRFLGLPRALGPPMLKLLLTFLFLRRRLNISCARIERQMTDIVSTLSLGDLKLGDKSNKYSFVMSVCPNLI